MQSSRILVSFDCLKTGKFMMKIRQPEEGWNFFWALKCCVLFAISSLIFIKSNSWPIIGDHRWPSSMNCDI